MCGVVGYAAGWVDPTLVVQMTEAIAERGPDGMGTWASESIVLGFRRLAVIDLHERSDQPMHLGNLHLVFNGEIYNFEAIKGELRELGHRFETAGDAEVLIHSWLEWGAGALARLNGMFAFAIWDELRKELTLGRDRFGEKPLFYYVGDKAESVVFGSSLRAVRLHPSVPTLPDLEVLRRYIYFEHQPESDRTFLSGIMRLPAAHLLTWRLGHCEVKPYWEPAEVEVPKTYGEATERFRDLFYDSVRLRLRSDVPVASSLSGGIDSSAIVGVAGSLAAETERHAFTATFPGFESDEWALASLVVCESGVQHHHAVKPDVDGLIEDLERFVVAQDEPVRGLSVYAQWKVSQHARQQGIVVLLDGQGADEILGGYVQARGFALRSFGSRSVSELAPDVSVFSAARSVVASMAYDFLPESLRGMYRNRQASPYTPAGESAALAHFDDGHSSYELMSDPFRRERFRETFCTSLPELLRYADRSSMSHAIEVRLPFLDHRLVEFSLSLPVGYLYRDGFRKAILRDAVRGLVPEAILNRRDKIGFEAPQKTWFEAASVQRILNETLYGGSLQNQGLIRIPQQTGEGIPANAAWRALNAELWLRSLSA